MTNIVKFKNNKLFWIFLAALILRIILLPFGNNDDLIVNAWWGRWIYLHGPKGFYQEGGWFLSDPTQAPFFSLLLAWTYHGYTATLHLMDFIKFHFGIIPSGIIWWWEKTYYAVTDFYWGYLMWMKVPAILADILTAILVYKVGLKISNKKKALVVPSLLLFLPFTWYVSALWGQYDSISNFLLLLTFLLLYRRRLIGSSIVYLLAGQMKPTVLIFAPIYLYYFFKQNPSIKEITISVFSVVALFWLLTAPFADRDVFSFTKDIIYPKVFFKERFEGLVNHSFNFWQLIAPQGGRSWMPFLGIPAYIWGYGSLLAIYIWSFVILRKNDFKSFLISLYLLSAGDYIFGMGMVDRYFYPAVIFLGILTYYYPKLMKWWILTALFFSANLFYSWGFPFFKSDVAWKIDVIIRAFSLTQIILFVICMNMLTSLNPGGIFKRIKWIN